MAALIREITLTSLLLHTALKMCCALNSLVMRMPLAIIEIGLVFCQFATRRLSWQIKTVGIQSILCSCVGL